MNDSFWLGVYPGLDKVHLDYIYSSVEGFIKIKLRIRKIIKLNGLVIY
jgi:hypothetical protein